MNYYDNIVKKFIKLIKYDIINKEGDYFEII